ncbi:MAG: hypothetical protein GXY41_03775 [Phycisphaerae bacterium]|nr:hypothetical protein [Phycisphaerae bacterium]
MNRREKHAAIIAYYESLGYEIVGWKDGYWLRKDGHKTFITTAKAARAAGIKPTPRPAKIALPWGDYATVAMLNRPRRK